MPGSNPGLRGRRSGIEVDPGAVRQARVEAGLSQLEVAEPEFTAAAICGVEKGRIKPSRRLLHQIARRTGRPMSYFTLREEITIDQQKAVDDLHRLIEASEFAAGIKVGEELLGHDPPRQIEADARFLLGRAYVRSADGKNAHPHLLRALELYELIGDQAQLAEVLSQIACALFLLEDIRALSFAYQSLDICERIRPRPSDLTVRTLVIIGMIFLRLQDWQRAIDTYDRALTEIGPAIGIRNLSLIHDNLSQALQRVDRFGDALRHARKAARLSQGSIDPSDVFRTEHNLGKTFLLQGELRAARVHLERALTLYEERELPPYYGGFATLSLAHLHMECDELDRAGSRLEEAFRLGEASNEPTHLANAWRLRGRLHFKRGAYELADDAFATAVSLFKSLQLPVDVFEVQVEHATALSAQGRTEEALALSQTANASGQFAVRRVQGGWGDVVAANWQRY